MGLVPNQIFPLRFLDADFHSGNLGSIFYPVRFYHNTGSLIRKGEPRHFLLELLLPSGYTRVFVEKRKQKSSLQPPSSARPGSCLVEQQCIRGRREGVGEE